MKRIPPVLKICGILCILLVGLVLVERMRGKIALKSWKRAAVTRGERLNLSELLPERPAAGENCAIGFIAAARSLTNGILFRESNLPKPIEFVSGTGAIPAVKLESWRRDGPDRKSITHTWEEIGREIVAAKEALESIEASLRKPGYDSGIVYTNGFLSAALAQGLMETKRAGEWLCGKCLWELKQRKNAEAFKTLNSLNRLVILQSSERLIIAQLVRYAIAHRAVSVLWNALAEHAFTEAQLAEIQVQWAKNDFSGDMLQSLEMERAMTIDHFRLVRTSSRNLTDALANQVAVAELLEEERGLIPPRISKRAQSVLWKIAWSGHDELHALQNWQRCIDRLRGIGWNGIGAAESQMPEQSNFYDRARYLFSTSPTDMTLAGTKALEMDTLMKLAVTAIAVERYWLAHRSYPAELSVLAPRFLRAIPRDAHGQPLRYELKQGSFLLYSVGRDGKDDGGDGSPPGNGVKGTMVDGKDMVWPSVAKR